MRTRSLGLTAIICSPLLCIDFFANGLFASFLPSFLSGVFNLIYTTGWMCSIIGLWQLKAAGDSKTGKGILITQLALLCLANVSNIYEVVNPGADKALYNMLDLFWPFSNFFMIVTGIVVAVSGTQQGWKRFTPLVVGLWLPVTFVVLPALFGRNDLILVISSIYSLVAWLFLGLSVYTSSPAAFVESKIDKLAYA